jgi:hypothetical protein
VTGLAFLLIVLAISGVGLLVLWMRNRDTTSLDQGIDEFQREMRALSPDKRQRTREDDRRRRG